MEYCNGPLSAWRLEVDQVDALGTAIGYAGRSFAGQDLVPGALRSIDG